MNADIFLFFWFKFMAVEQSKSRQKKSNVKTWALFLMIWLLLSALCVYVCAQLIEDRILMWIFLAPMVLLAAVGAIYLTFRLMPGDSFDQAQMHLHRKQYDAARDAFIRYAEEDPAYASESYYCAARAAMRSNNVDEPVQKAAGAFTVSQADIEGAIRLYRQAIELNPLHDRALGALAQLLPEDAPERYELFQRAVDITPRYKVLRELAAYYRVQGDFTRAYQCLESACDYNPDRIDAFDDMVSLCDHFHQATLAEPYRKRTERRRK
jgi:tetratricopeptide (TPR) repeat protein